jgi:hypothetical protein
MKNHIINVRDMDSRDRPVFERAIGRPLQENVQLMIQLVGADASASPDGATAHMPEWSDVYNGRSDEEIAEVEKIALARVELSRPSE